MTPQDDNPTESKPPRSLVEAFSEIAQRFHTTEDPEQTLRRITDTAITAIPACDAASVSLLDKTGPVNRAATSQLARDADCIQHDEREGPCVASTTEGRWLYSTDLCAETRWPRSSRRIAAELGIRSLISCRLILDAAPNQTLGGLNLYSMKSCAFSEEDCMMSILLSSLGAVVVDASRQQAHLRAAIESRQIIGEAVGILRSQQAVSSEEAFRMLSQASQRMNVKLRELAKRIVDAPPRARGQAQELTSLSREGPDS